MGTLTAYMDETGHSKDERQRFNGMAGLLAPTREWERLEIKWKKTLKEFKLPYFHMKDFAKRKQKSKNPRIFHFGSNSSGGDGSGGSGAL
jgi:hypothetical protein